MGIRRFTAPDFEHGESPAVGVLLANIGTPQAPTAKALRPYLRQFLSDPRVIELPRWQWLPILYLLVLTFRPRRSAKLYAKIWTAEGSPLLVIARRQAAAVEKLLNAEVGSPLHVTLGMGYGKPSMAEALGRLRRGGCRKILVLPLFPQYSGTSSAAIFDALFAELATWRWIPELRTIQAYHDDRGYIRALASSIREVWTPAGGQPDQLLFSFHGVPLRYIQNGDPYHCQCHKTGRLVAEELELDEGRYAVTFQSHFGSEEWIKPATDVTVRAMARSGVRSLDVVCPGFSADCLETLEEIAIQNREFFEQNGGEQFRFIPCLNDRPDHVRALADLILRHLQGWIEPRQAWDGTKAADAAAASRERAENLGARGARADAGFSS
ncbi:MAG: ferrochelatase [Thermoanaerobaculia bacterium]